MWFVNALKRTALFWVESMGAEKREGMGAMAEIIRAIRAMGLKKWSKEVDLSERFLWNEVSSGNLKVCRVRRRVLVTEDQMREFLDKHSDAA